MMYQTMRWFGPNDPVALSYIKQAGCTGVVTALHQIPVGDIWTVAAIEERKKIIEDAGLNWKVVESLPVSEDIKKRNGQYLQHIEHYKMSMQNLAQCGIEVITYNFMPILDWLRTDVYYPMPDGSTALYFEHDAFVAFDLFLLERPGAAQDYDATTIERATKKFHSLTAAQKETLFKNALLGLPGSEVPFTKDEVLTALRTYDGISREQLQEHLYLFLEAIVPLAASLHLKMAIHPDDPPFSVLGLPRIMSSYEDAKALIERIPDTANGFCFCTGSFGARAENDIPAMLDALGDHIHFLHLRNTKRDAAGNFFEADHLYGDTDMVTVIRKCIQIQKRRNISLPMRPDHGHQMLDDLQKKTYPGYSAIGRLKGLAELRGVEHALLREA